MQARRASGVVSITLGIFMFSHTQAAGHDADHGSGPEWELSTAEMPTEKDRPILLKLDEHRVIWIGGVGPTQADSNRTFIYDTRTRTFREAAPMPADKRMDTNGVAGVLKDGTVVVVGAALANPTNVVSFRYDPRRDRWARTGDLPEPQQFAYMPTALLKDGRLLVAGGGGPELVNGEASLNAFVYDASKKSTAAILDAHGNPTGETMVVQGKWDYTRRVKGGARSQLSSGHFFGNLVLLKDGRVLVAGGHTFWAGDGSDLSNLNIDTHFFDPGTGIWSEGAPLPIVAWEDSQVEGSIGGRANGVCLAALDNGKVVIAGGGTQTEGASYFDTLMTRRSILVMTPAANPMKSTYKESPNAIPSGIGSGALFGDTGRNQLPCYVISRNEVYIAGGQNSWGEDLFDTYIFDTRDFSLTRGPDRSHAVPEWGVEAGYPADYEIASISTLAVGMRSGHLVFGQDALVHGGSYDTISYDFRWSPQADQISADRPGCYHRHAAIRPTASQRAAAWERFRARIGRERN